MVDTDAGLERVLSELADLAYRVEQLERTVPRGSTSGFERSASPESASPESASPESASPESASPESGSPESASPESAPPPQADAGSGPPGTPSTDDVFWALNGLKRRLGVGDDGQSATRSASTDGAPADANPRPASGAVMMVGTVVLPDGSPVDWQWASAPHFDTPWSPAAAALSALGHPVRLELLRHLLSGVRTTAELVAQDGMGTTGQLHHHLRELVATGWVVHTARGQYAVPAARIIPLLVTISGVTP